MRIVHTDIRINDETQPIVKLIEEEKEKNCCKISPPKEHLNRLRERQEKGLPLFDDE